MIFLTSPYVVHETGEDADTFGLLCYSPLDGETETDCDWILDHVDLTEKQAEDLAKWASARFASATNDTFDRACLEELGRKAEEMADFGEDHGHEDDDAIAG